MKPVLVKKQRKPRGIKLTGEKSLNMCPCCKAFHCDPMSMSHKFDDQQDQRRRAGVCTACGHNPCVCKSELPKYKDGTTAW